MVPVTITDSEKQLKSVTVTISNSFFSRKRQVLRNEGVVAAEEAQESLGPSGPEIPKKSEQNSSPGLTLPGPQSPKTLEKKFETFSRLLVVLGPEAQGGSVTYEAVPNPENVVVTMIPIFPFQNTPALANAPLQIGPTFCLAFSASAAAFCATFWAAFILMKSWASCAGANTPRKRALVAIVDDSLKSCEKR